MMTLSSTVMWPEAAFAGAPEELCSARNFITFLQASVLPAPDSPDTITDWSFLFFTMSSWVIEATEYTCGILSLVYFSDSGLSYSLLIHL